MIPILFEASEQTFSTMGLGALKDCLSCYVTEERNGSYELELTYPITGARFGDLEVNRIILAKANYIDQEQPFRIYKITKPLDGIVTVNARHISYDLSGYPLAVGSSVSGLANALTYINANSMVTPNPFTIAADHSSVGTFTPSPLRSIRQWLGGVEGSLLDAFGGEWHFDRFTATLCSARGSNRGVTIMYGKNLTQLTQEESSADLYSGVIPYYYQEDSNTYVEGTKQSTGATLTPERVLALDCSDQFENTPTAGQLNSYAQRYITRSGLASPKVNLDIDFVQLDQVTDRVDLCDTVTVYYSRLGITATAKCIKTVWDTLLDRYDSVTVGDAKTTLADTINDLQNAESGGSSSGGEPIAQAIQAELDTGELFIGNSSLQTGAVIDCTNANRHARIGVSTTGLIGMYDSTNSKWAFFADASGNLYGQDSVRIPIIVSGTIAEASVTNRSYADFTISFGHTFASAPNVVATLTESNQTNYNFGVITCYVHSVTTTGATIRVFNYSQSARSVGIRWIAVG